MLFGDLREGSKNGRDGELAELAAVNAADAALQTRLS